MSADTEEVDSPTQEDINEGIVLQYRLITVRQGFRRDTQEAGTAAVYGRKVIAESTSDAVLFRKLRAEGVRLCFPRVFHVNDHGNVTEYSYSGKVIGEWV